MVPVCRDAVRVEKLPNQLVPIDELGVLEGEADNYTVGARLGQGRVEGVRQRGPGLTGSPGAEYGLRPVGVVKNRPLLGKEGSLN